jgi:hypothetical protein
VLSFTKHVNELTIKINSSTIFGISKTKKPISMPKDNLKFDINRSSRNMLRFNSFAHNKQTFTITNGPSLTLNHICVKASVSINNAFQEHVRQILKKKLPSTIFIELLFASNSVSHFFFLLFFINIYYV